MQTLAFKMIITTQNEANDINLGDAQLTGIFWENDFKDLAFAFSTTENQSSKLICVWHSNLKINLDFKDMIGSLVWNAQIVLTGNKEWHINIDFGSAPEGEISLKCNELQYIIQS